MTRTTTRAADAGHRRARARSAWAAAAVALVCAAPGLADPGKVVVPAVDFGKVEPARAARVEQALKEALVQALGDGVVFAGDRACAGDAACAKALLDAHAADEVLGVRLEKGADAGTVVVVVEARDAAHEVVAAGRATVAQGAADPALRGLVVATLRPSKWTGTLIVDGMPPGAQVLVDGVPVLARSRDDRTRVAVGRHRVAFYGVDGALVGTNDVDVGFGAQVVVRFPAGSAPAPAAPPAPRAGVPLWPSFVVGGVAALAAGIATTVLAIELGNDGKYADARDRLHDAARGDASLRSLDDPRGQEWRGYGASQSADFKVATTAAAATNLTVLDMATTLSYSIVFGGYFIAGVAGVATVALVSLALIDPPTDDASQAAE